MDIHARNHVWYIKWVSTILMIITMSMTASNIYPLNIILGLISSIGWTYVGIRWNDRAIIMLNTIAVGIYLIGILSTIENH